MDSTEALGRIMAAQLSAHQHEALRAISARLDQLSEVARRAQRMFDHGSPLAHLFAATVLGVAMERRPLTGMRVDGTTPPAPPTDQLTAARALTAGVPAAVREVAAAWAQLREQFPDALSAGPADRLCAALDTVELITRDRL
jgi:hypothetical protein